MKLTEINISDMFGTEHGKKALVLSGQRNELAALQFAPPGIDPSLPLHCSTTENIEKRLMDPSLAHFRNYGLYFKFEGSDYVVLRSDAGWTNMRESAWCPTIRSGCIRFEQHQLPSISRQNLNEREKKALYDHLVIKCGSVSIHNAQDYAHLDSLVLDEKCGVPASSAFEIAFRSVDISGVKAYTCSSELVYVCERHSKLLQEDLLSMGHEGKPVKMYFNEGILEVSVKDTCRHDCVYTQEHKLLAPVKIYATESLANRLPHLEFFSPLSLGIFDPQWKRLPSSFCKRDFTEDSSNIASIRKGFISPPISDKDCCQVHIGTISDTLPEKYVPQLMRE